MQARALPDLEWALLRGPLRERLACFSFEFTIETATVSFRFQAGQILYN